MLERKVFISGRDWTFILNLLKNLNFHQQASEEQTTEEEIIDLSETSFFNPP